MKTPFLSLVAALMFAICSPVAAQSSVWKAELNGSVVYLGGTCHMLRAQDFPLPAEFDLAYAEAEELYFETEIDRLASMEAQQMLMAAGLFTDGSTLQDSVSEEAWAAIEKHCNANGLPVVAFAQMKPWMFAVTMAVLEWQKMGAGLDGVDSHYNERAKADGKATHGLEEFEEHLLFITSVGVGQESEFILNTLRDVERAPTIIGELIEAWRSGDVEGIDEYFVAEMRAEFPDIYRTLILGRNQAWLSQISALFETPEVELVLVGAGHFGGENGLLALLRGAGVRIDQVITD